MSREELQQFYRGMVKNPSRYGYDENGNLQQKDKDGSVIKTIPLPSYRPPTFEELDVMEKKRSEDIAIATKKYNDARKLLRELYLRPNQEENRSELMAQNRAVEQADRELQRVRFPLRYTKFYGEGTLEIREFDTTQSTNKNKNRTHVTALEVYPYTLQDQYVRVGKAPERPLKSMAEIQAAAAKNVPVVLFSEPETNDYGFLSLSWTVDLSWKGATYTSAKQAIYAEIAKAFQDEGNLHQIMSAETADAIQYSVKDVPGEINVNEVKWATLMKRLLNDINLLKFTQYPELGLRLLQTQEAVLGAYVPEDNLLGIGISIDNVLAQNPINWTGQNLLGKALMEIRQHLKEEQEKAQQAAAAAAPAPKRSIRIPKQAPASASAPASAPAPQKPSIRRVRSVTVPSAVEEKKE